MPGPVVIAVSFLVVLLVIALSLYFTNTLCSWGSSAGSNCPASPSPASPSPALPGIPEMIRILSGIVPNCPASTISDVAAWTFSNNVYLIPVGQQCPTGTAAEARLFGGFQSCVPPQRAMMPPSIFTPWANCILNSQSPAQALPTGVYDSNGVRTD